MEDNLGIEGQVGLGVDIVEIERMKRILARTPSFRTRMFSEDERAYCDAKATPEVHYATRFAAKEAVLKEIGCGLAAGLRQVHVSLTPAPHLEAPVFGSMHALARAGLSGGLAAMVSVPGDTPPSLQVCPLTPANFL